MLRRRYPGRHRRKEHRGDGRAAGCRNRPRFWEYVASYAITPQKPILTEAGLVKDQLYWLNLSLLLNIFRLRYLIYDKGSARHPEQETGAPHPGWCTCSPIAAFAFVAAQLPCDPAIRTGTGNSSAPPENAGHRGPRYARTPGRRQRASFAHDRRFAQRKPLRTCRSRSRTTKNVKTGFFSRGKRARLRPHKTPGEGVPPPAAAGAAARPERRTVHVPCRTSRSSR